MQRIRIEGTDEYIHTAQHTSLPTAQTVQDERREPWNNEEREDDGDDWMGEH